jgi:hypothetical protein
MKVLPVVLLLTVFSCHFSDSDQPFAGNWSFCDQRGRYCEIHVSDEVFDYYWAAVPSGVRYAFQITQDTLLYLNLDSDDSTWYKFQLTFVSNDHMRLNDAEHSLELFRITTPIKTSFQLDSTMGNGKKRWILREDFLDRLTNANCKDPRSPAEILRDSIETKRFLDSIASQRFLDSVHLAK